MNEPAPKPDETRTEKETEDQSKHPYLLYIIGTALIFIFMLVVVQWATHSDWVLK